MESGTILFGVLPLIAFAIVDSFTTMKTALISAILLAIAEGIFTILYFGELDYVTLSSILMVAGLAIVSIKTKSDKYFKLQPAILSLLFGTLLTGSYIIDHPILLEMAIKYKSMLPDHVSQNLEQVFIQELLRKGTLNSGILILIHSALMYYAAKKWNNWAWLACRVIVFYLFLAIAGIITTIQIKSIYGIA